MTKLTDRQLELLSALGTPVEYRPAISHKWQSAYQRDVYVAQGGRDWFLTYGSELPYGGPFNRADVFALRDLGLVKSTYPADHTANDCFTISDAGRLALQQEERG